MELEFSRELWAADTDVNLISLFLITKALEVKSLSQGEYTKQENKTKERALREAESQDRVVSWQGS